MRSRDGDYADFDDEEERLRAVWLRLERAMHAEERVASWRERALERPTLRRAGGAALTRALRDPACPPLVRRLLRARTLLEGGWVQRPARALGDGSREDASRYLRSAGFVVDESDAAWLRFRLPSS